MGVVKYPGVTACGAEGDLGAAVGDGTADAIPASVDFDASLIPVAGLDSFEEDRRSSGREIKLTLRTVGDEAVGVSVAAGPVRRIVIPAAGLGVRNADETEGSEGENEDEFGERFHGD